jgi:phosphohistidine phosphatase
MDLYLIRHAEAVPQGKRYPSDEERPLNDLGQEQARLLAEGLQRLQIDLEVLVSSPLVRAQQTAEGLREHWIESAPELQTCVDLAPDGKPKKVARFVNELEAGSVGLVGHMPDLGTLAAWLLGGRRVKLDFAKAGVALIRCAEGVGKGAGELVWMVTPEWVTQPEPIVESPRTTSRRRDH